MWALRECGRAGLAPSGGRAALDTRGDRSPHEETLVVGGDRSRSRGDGRGDRPYPRARGIAIRGGGRSVPAYRRRRGVRAGVVGVVRDAPIAATGRRRNSSGGKAKQDHLNLSER